MLHPFILSFQDKSQTRKVKTAFIKPVQIMLCVMPLNATYNSALCSLICVVYFCSPV